VPTVTAPTATGHPSPPRARRHAARILAIVVVAVGIPATLVSLRADRAPVVARPDLQRVLVELTSGSARIAPGATAYVAGPHGTWSGAAGVADTASGQAMAADARMRLESVSKIWTAVLVLQLAEHGRLALDHTVERWLPGLLPFGDRITLRQLLTHTSGIFDNNDAVNHPDRVLARVKDPVLRAELVRLARRLQADPTIQFPPRVWIRLAATQPLYFPPGTGYHYSNTNYLYLGLIAEAVTKKPLGKALHDRFFAPLGLDATWYQAAEEPRAPTAHGYRLVGTSRTTPAIDLSDGTKIVPFTSVVTAAAGAGSIATTSQDAAMWARLLYTGKVLGPDMTAQMLGGTSYTVAYRPPVPYGLGVQALSIDGRPTIGHSGRLLGFRAAIRYLPGEATTIAVLTNQSRADPGLIVRSLLSIVFAPEPACFRCPYGSAS
jgi:D-alanyl-D-alanine carboxypeptidase